MKNVVVPTARKALGQNFLLDRNITDKIVRLASKEWHNTYAVEVGPGPGGLTRSLIAANPHRLIVVEKDERFRSGLEELKVAAGPAFSSIVFADMTKLNQHRQLLDILLSLNQSDDEKELHVLGNLPFNVSTVLLTGWLRDLHEQRGLFHDYQRLFKRVRLTFMFQKEVAERILARKESAHRSRLSVVTQAVCSVHRLYDVPSTVFVPRPKVDATVVQFEPLSVPLFKGDWERLETLLRWGFNAPRKKLRSNLLPHFPSIDSGKSHLKDSHLDRRPTELSVNEWITLCHELFD